MEIHTVIGEQNELAGKRLGTLTISLEIDLPDADTFDDLKKAIAGSADPHFTKSFLNNRCRFLDRFEEFFSIGSQATGAGHIALALCKTDRYHQLLAAIRANDLEGLLED